MTPRDKERYSRQILFHGIGEAGQQRLLDARVVVVGCGALGSFEAGALARAGVGYLRIIDRDYVELSNLQRQWLFDQCDVEQALPKSMAAARQLAAINSDIRIEPVVADLTPANADELLGESDLILDGTDNFETRYLINDYSVSRARPWVYGAAVGSYGISMAVVPGKTACLRCIYPDPPPGAQPTCETAGVLGSLTALIASLQVSEAIKILCGAEPSRKITTVDVWTGEIRQISQPGPDPQCPACGLRQFPYLNGEHRAPVSLCGRNAVQIHERARPLDLRELAERLAPLGLVRANEFALRFEIPPYLLTIFPDGRAIVKGTTEVGVARSLYARYIGS
ncbi:MAG TPA: ThiF family adenylyltransferase [Bryobacteraceae bacterium]|jgi:adenylyltransferase/sulfurtransferase|nr:ThiF family adenylyltransferase [Bryobacteraceae bacterium]